MKNNLLSIHNMINIFKDNEVHDDLLKISSSHDAFLIYEHDLSPIKYTSKLHLGLKNLLTELNKELIANDFITEPIYLDGNLFGIHCKDSFTINIQAGGQLTFTTSSVLDIHDMYDELAMFHGILTPILEEHKIAILRIGYHPTVNAIQSNKMPSDLNTIIRRNLAEHDPKALYSLYGTADLSLTIKYRNENDMVEKFRVSSFLLPYMATLFASSAYFEGRETKILSNRMKVKQDMKNVRDQFVSFCFANNFSYQRYIKDVLKKPMYGILVKGKYIDVENKPMESFLYGNLNYPALETNQRAKLEDFTRHLATINPAISLTEDGLKLKLADSNNRPMVIALSAMIKGLLFDNENMEKLHKLIVPIPTSKITKAYEKSHTYTLNSSIHNATISEQLQEFLTWAEQGLLRLKDTYNLQKDEITFLDPIKNAITTKKTFADEIIEATKTDILEVFKYVNAK